MLNLSMSDKKTIYHQIADIIFTHLDPNTTEAVIFGSRVQNTNRPFSDVDICLKSNQSISLSIVSLIREELENSNIPYKIDIVDYRLLSDEFKQVALEKVISLNQFHGQNLRSN